MISFGLKLNENIPVISLTEIRLRHVRMGGRTSQSTNTVCTNWTGLVIQAPVNWREGLDNRMSSGSVIN